MGRDESMQIRMVVNEVRKVVKGKDDCIYKVFSAILAGGHILIEDVPGVGKTTLATAFSKALSLDNHRMQFTPDVMPADILGFNMYQKDTGKFVYYQGAIMCNLFLADEINRTSPKTQSALLEVMEEGMVTVEGKSRPVPEPFIVMATQNPKGSAGTQLLPESQLDRFMICMSMGYPELKDEVNILKGKSGQSNGEVRPVLKMEQLLKLKAEVEAVHVSDAVYSYIAMLSQATRDNAYIELGLSPRGSIACVRMAKAWAYLNERDYVLPEDVVDIFMDIAKHRIVLNTKARVAHVSAAAVLEEIISQVRQPASYMKKEDYVV
ncbi:MAG: MoxR family ATPase [Lachnospiraceae bacterium]|nr:MoxR family ATPase [Lachnospiraceae bacterium]